MFRSCVLNFSIIEFLFLTAGILAVGVMKFRVQIPILAFGERKGRKLSCTKIPATQ